MSENAATDDRTPEERIEDEMVERHPDHCPACGVAGTEGRDSGTRYCLNPECATVEFVADEPPDEYRRRIDEATARERGDGPLIVGRSAWRDANDSEDEGTLLVITGFETYRDAKAFAETTERNRLIRSGWDIEQRDQ